MDLFKDLIDTLQESGKPELIEKVKEVEGKITENISNITTRASMLENDLAKAIEKRENIKKLIKSKTGLEDLTEESVNSYFDSINNNGDAKKLQEMLEMTKKEYESKVKELSTRLTQKQIDSKLLESGLLDNTNGKVAKKVIMDELKSNLVQKDGELVYVDENNSIVYDTDGKPLSVEKKLESLYNDEEYNALFKGKSGGGKSGHKPSE